MGDAWLEELDHAECLALLQLGNIARIAFVVDGFPVVLPVNYRFVEHEDGGWLFVRTRPGGVIDRAPVRVALQIDGVDTLRKIGWSVLVRGTLDHVDLDAEHFRDRLDPHPWLASERSSWLIIEPVVVSGRRLRGAPPEWAFRQDAYL